jgi:hypothetical protein
MNTILIILITLHGLVHLLGFAKALNPARVTQINQTITPAEGLLWLIATVLFVAAAACLGLGADWWWAPCIVAVLLSQYLVILCWSSAKFGTVVNVLLLAAALTAYAGWQFKHDDGAGIIYEEKGERVGMIYNPSIKIPQGNVAHPFAHVYGHGIANQSV